MTEYRYSLRNALFVAVTSTIIGFTCLHFGAPQHVSLLLSAINGFATGLIFPIRRRV